MVAPEITDYYTVAQKLRIICKTWFLIRIPNFVLKLIFGEGFYVIKETPKVVPKRLIELGFSFRYTNIENSLKHQLLEN